MSEEENYMDDLLKSLDNPETEGVPEETHTDEEILSMLGDELPQEYTADEGADTAKTELEASPDETDKQPEDAEAAAAEDAGLPQMPDMAELTENTAETFGMDIEGLDEAIASETELQLAGQLKKDEMDLAEDAGTDDLAAASEGGDLLDDMGLPDDAEADSHDMIGADDDLDDVLSMLDNDEELAEINDMLKKSDNNEPIVDDMMNLLNQMADDEAASVNAGVKNIVDDDGGVPLPELPDPVLPKAETDTDAGKKKKDKKKKTEDEEEKEAKEPGKLGKFFKMLTDDLVPEPTEEELAAEKEAKEAKKQENQTKKEEEKAAKAEEKKAKAEEKEAAKKAKAEAAQQKKKEKDAAKAEKKAAKAAKQAEQGPNRRIPPKKMAVGAVFGATVGGAILVSTSILSAQGYLRSARKAYYNQDYKTVYQATYGMELDDTKSDGLIQARSEVILKMQRRYDSYQNNVKMGRRVEALDALLQGLSTYDQINADAQMYDVLTEVDAIKEEILNTLSAKYGLDETAARELISNEDALAYTVALTNIINNR